MIRVIKKMAGFVKESCRAQQAEGSVYRKNPRICRVNDHFEPEFNVGTLLFASGFLASASCGTQQASTPQTREGSRFLGVGSKTEC